MTHASSPEGRKSESKVKAKATATPKQMTAMRRELTIVGIGASAGGLEALEQFFQNVPPASGLAFVVVQHLDPTHTGMLAELLQRSTPMPVARIEDNMPVQRDHVYVIPPNRDLALLHGVMHLMEPTAPRGFGRPIDYFFASLAADQQARSIGIVLSGMGSDGTSGLRAIKEQSGLVLVQEPASAKFDSMPQSAIDAGLADVIAPAQALAGELLARLHHTHPLGTRADVSIKDRDRSGLDKVILLLRAQTGNDFSQYKKSTMYRRIERRMGLHQLHRIQDYVSFLRDSTQEVDLLFKELLIGVTSFFRDPAVWEQIKTEVIPQLVALYPVGATLRAWVPACSTGEEAYSLAMAFREALEQIRPTPHYAMQIFATDLDPAAIDKARVGVYPADISTDVSPERLRRFFVQEDGRFRVAKDIREMVIFAPQNLVMDPPFTKLDLLSCRNLLIYLESTLQNKLIPLFHYSLNPGGVLILGTSETVGQDTTLFASLPGKTRVYRRVESLVSTMQVEFPVDFSRATAGADADVLGNTSSGFTPTVSEPNLQSLTDSLLLKQFAPAAVLTTAQGDITYICGKTGKYLEPAAGKANLNIFAMARDGLSGALDAAFAETVRQRTTVTHKALPVGTNGSTQWVDITVQALMAPAALRGMVLVVFADVAAPPPAPAPGKVVRAGAHSAQMTAMAQELQQAREDIRNTREEMQTSQEELKSTNEELQSTNEELQSTNEELTTSKEEMQSMNEELHTVNHELQDKLDELSRASDDMKNLLNSTEIATLFLDSALKVRRFTIPMAGIIKLISSDVGRPITDLVSLLDYPQLADDVTEVLRTLIFQQHQIAATDGRWFNVRIMPYRTQTDRIDGAVVTFSDISDTKALEVTLRRALEVLQSHSEEQSAELDAAKRLEAVLMQAKVILKQQLAEQNEQLRQSKSTQTRGTAQSTRANLTTKPDSAS